ncbi:MAG TPA: hypothetical protein VK975_06255 [Acidimicrobiales bacterium]|nr:hypothetical protein [Acidimicrobiales bacterium]
MAALVATGGNDGDQAAERAGAGAQGEWGPMTASPLAHRILAASAWTDDELVVWGGRGCAAGRCDNETSAPFGDGAAYDPDADRWRALAPSPLSARSGAAAAWTGDEVVMWGGRDASGPLVDGAAYDPEEDSWRTISPSPLGARSVQATWTGEEVLLWGGTVAGSAGQDVFGDGAAYDPRADRWRMLARAPLGARFDMVSTWTGEELVVWGGRAGAANLDDGAAYAPASDTWRPISPSPLSSRVVRGVWTGAEVLVWGGERGAQALDDGAAYDPDADRWRGLAPSPLPARRGNALAWTGEEMLVWGGGGGTGSFFFGTGGGYTPSADTWRELPSSPGRFIPEVVWTGDELVVWGGIVARGGAAPGAIEPAADGVRYGPGA